MTDTTLPDDPNALNAAAQLNTDLFVRVHRKMTVVRQELKAKFDAEDAVLKEKQATIESVLLNFLNTNDMKSARTAHGTFYWQEKITPRGADWDAFYKWVAKNDAFDFLERRITRTAVKKYMDDNGGALPPGIDVYREREVRVRKNND